MSTPISLHQRDMLVRTLPLVRQHKEAIVARLAWALRGVSRQRSARDVETIARTLTELLIDQAHALSGTGTLRPLDDVSSRHAALGIDGRFYSRFGDALVPVMSDLLGPNVPRDVAPAWCDAFWMVVRALKPVKVAANG
jgi:hemoglobin-like flavoprotein